MEQRTYFTLKLKGTTPHRGGTGGLRSGDVVTCTGSSLTIGETADCEVRYPSLQPQYQPEYYATILRSADGQRWHIVKRSAHVDVSIMGHGGFAYACQLHDGDTIVFGGQRQTVQFHAHYDANYAKTPDNHRFLPYAFMAIVLLVVLVGGWLLFRQTPAAIMPDEAAQLEESVFLVRVDSVEYVVGTSQYEEVVATLHFESGDNPVGTAFLTDDGRLVTARHCVEYWLGEPVELTTKIVNLDDDDIIRWAALAETFNYEHEGSDTLQLLRSYCSVWAPRHTATPTSPPDFEPVFRFTSTDDSVHINRERDGIITLDDFTHRYYWRTVTPYFSRRDMELGDIMYVSVSRKGQFELADSAFFRSLKREEPLAIYGFPENDAQVKAIDFEAGNLKMWHPGKSLNENLVHSGQLTHGHSGGPVLVRGGKSGFVVIGVVSKVDNLNDNLMMSVPVTAMQR